jgi:hypothetical protein
MKSSLLGITGCFLLGAAFLLQAQTNAPAAGAPPQNAQATAALSFLTPAEQLQYATARAKALADSPDLKAEGEVIVKQGASSMNGQATAEEKLAFIEKMNSHRQKLRQAMLKEAPTLEPIFSKIDKHISEMKAKQLGAMQNSPPPNSPPAAGSSSH